jgi:hypothetical protein
VLQMVAGLLQQLVGRNDGGNCPPRPGCDPQQPPSFPPYRPPGGCFPPPPPHCRPETGKTWDVFFDSKNGTKTEQRSPIILDLNGNGKADITGSNIKGNGKLEGKTVKGFDLDLNNRQWAYKSVARRPGEGAPALPAGTKMQIYDKAGKLVAEKSFAEVQAQGKKGGNYGLAAGQRAEFRDTNGRIVGELKSGNDKGQMMYHWENKNENEWTKAWDSATGGDGILVCDADGDGQISSSKELFGEFDFDGQKKFKNGYEKLAANFDRDGDGVVRGAELNGLKIWEDRNGDGITQKGELVELRDRGVRSLNTRFDANDMSSTYRK